MKAESREIRDLGRGKAHSFLLCMMCTFLCDWRSMEDLFMTNRANITTTKSTCLCLFTFYLQPTTLKHPKYCKLQWWSEAQALCLIVPV